MRRLNAVVLFALLPLCGCTSLQFLAHAYSDNAPESNVYRYEDGGSGIYYSFVVNGVADADTFVFFFASSGCASWKYSMPGYVDGLTVPARVFALNKRFVSDLQSGVFGCGRDFDLANNPDQWLADYSAFVAAQLKATPVKPKHVVLVDVSEGALTSVRVAGSIAEVTHLAIVGDGGYSMRQALTVLKAKGSILFDVEVGWREVSTDPHSVEKRWYGHPYRYWAEVMDIEPLPYYAKLEIPILVGIGERDESVPVESARFLAAHFESLGKRNLVLEVYPGANHVLRAHGVSYRPDFFKRLSTDLCRGNASCARPAAE